MSDKRETAIFAGGCFWCMVKPFDTQPGIESVVSGYTGGHVANPTYEQAAVIRQGILRRLRSRLIPKLCLTKS